MQTLKFVLLKQQDAKKNAPILPDNAGALAAADPHVASQLHTVEYAVLLGAEDYKLLNKSVLQKAGSKE